MGYTMQLLVGVIVFALPGVDPAAKKVVHGWHGPVGITLMVVSLGTVVTGVLTYVGKTSDVQYTDTLMGQQYYNALTSAGVLTLPLGMLVAHAVAARKADTERIRSTANRPARSVGLPGGSNPGLRAGWP
jgi:uncharacterized membrane protein YidH (DUF202 family)